MLFFKKDFNETQLDLRMNLQEYDLVNGKEILSIS